MIEAYFDESGIHKDAPVCAVAGFFGFQNSWRVFEKGWNFVLEQHGLLSHGFHAKEFWGRKLGKRVPPYEGWTDRRANKFLVSLVDVVYRSSLIPCGHTICTKDWADLPLNARKWLSGAIFKNTRYITTGSPNKSYYILLQFCFLEPLIQGKDIVHYFLGADATFAAHAITLFKRLKEDEDINPNGRMGSCGFPSSKDTPGLQAADLLSYLSYQKSLARFHNKPGKVEDAILRRMLHNRREDQKFLYIEKKAFESILRMSNAKSEEKKNLQNELRARMRSGDFLDTSHPGNSFLPRSIVLFGQGIAPEQKSLPPSCDVRKGRPVFDPRREGS